MKKYFLLLNQLNYLIKIAKELKKKWLVKIFLPSEVYKKGEYKK